MRKIILSLGISLDGYIARSNGDVDFLFRPKDYPNDAFGVCDTAIMGRKTLDVGLKMSGGTLPGGFKYYVFSRSQPTGERYGAMFTNEPPGTFVERLRKADGKNIWLMGGAELARDFLKEDLVEEIHLGIVPVLLGEGIRLFLAGFPQREFSLMENKSYSGGLVELRYERKRP
ncbi:MAG: dihydrofolate reductase family protein [Candidatus Sulfotelmatobacter sp.]